jgi:hypothetical protein
MNEPNAAWLSVKQGAAMSPEAVAELARQIAEQLRQGQPGPYLDVREAAAYCRVAVQTIYNNRRHIERMPGIRKLLFTREALDKWLAGRRRMKPR